MTSRGRSSHRRRRTRAVSRDFASRSDSFSGIGISESELTLHTTFTKTFRVETADVETALSICGSISRQFGKH